MKKLFALILVLILLPIAALSEVDVASMTDQELTDLIAACSAELMARNKVDPDGILIFEYEGIKLYQIGDAYTAGEFLFIPVALYNDNNYEVIIGAESANCNGWDIYSSGCSASAKAKKKGTLTFSLGDADVTAIDQIISLKFCWKVFNNDIWKIEYNQEEPSEHRFW